MARKVDDMVSSSTLRPVRNSAYYPCRDYEALVLQAGVVSYHHTTPTKSELEWPDLVQILPTILPHISSSIHRSNDSRIL